MRLLILMYTMNLAAATAAAAAQHLYKPHNIHGNFTHYDVHIFNVHQLNE